MTLQEFNSMLINIQGFSASKVAYRLYPEKTPAMPFIVYFENASDNFAADGIAYSLIKRIQLELYTKKKDLITEGKVESALTSAGIFFQKNEEYLSDEKCYQIIYELEI